MAAKTGPKSTVVVPVRVQARGGHSEIQGVQDGRLRVKTKAPPVDGRANKDVIRQLASEFGVSPSRVSLKSGAARRDKTFVISNPDVLPSWLGAVNRNP